MVAAIQEGRKKKKKEEEKERNVVGDCLCILLEEQKQPMHKEFKCLKVVESGD